MKSPVLIITANLLPWYNELDDHVEVNDPSFPELVRERIERFGEFTIDSISRFETRLRQKNPDKS